MGDITVVCDRCGKTIEGAEFDHGTSGFYRTELPPWSLYTEDHEKVICDDCMWGDPRYCTDYPPSDSIGTDPIVHNGHIYYSGIRIEEILADFSIDYDGEKIEPMDAWTYIDSRLQQSWTSLENPKA